MQNLKKEKEFRVALNNVNVIFHSSFYIEERVYIFYFLASSLRPMFSPYTVRREHGATELDYSSRLLGVIDNSNRGHLGTLLRYMLSVHTMYREHVPIKNSHFKRAGRTFFIGKRDFVWAGRPPKTRRSTAANRRALRTTRPFKTPVLAH